MVSIVWNFVLIILPFLLLTFFVKFRSLVPNISVMRIYVPSSFAPSIVYYVASSVDPEESFHKSCCRFFSSSLRTCLYSSDRSSHRLFSSSLHCSLLSSDRCPTISSYPRCTAAFTRLTVHPTVSWHPLSTAACTRLTVRPIDPFSISEACSP